ncbi:MAG: ankyrin repeat domain-containing protein [Deltaproteobacteria bacterium]|nr:ankyrin repeat domain-containing protein [Deltaproteobacteria bacterium]
MPAASETPFNLPIDQALFDACQVGDVDRIRQALRDGADPNARAATGSTPLHTLLDQGTFDDRSAAAKILLAAGAGPHARTDAGVRVTSTHLKTNLLLRNARRGDDSPPPLVLYQGAEHPLFEFILEFAPDAREVGERVHWATVKPARKPLGPEVDADEVLTLCDLYPEVSPEVPDGMTVSFQLAETFGSNDKLRMEFLGQNIPFGGDYSLDFGYHTDASYEQAWRALPKHREVLRLSDLQRRFASPEIRPEETTDRLVEELKLLVASNYYVSDLSDELAAANILSLGQLQAILACQIAPSTLPSPQLTRSLTDHLSYYDILGWNDSDHRIAACLAHGDGLALLDAAIDCSDISVDRHAHFRALMQRFGSTESELLHAVLQGWRIGHRWTGRELWVITRPIEQLVSALTDPTLTPQALQRVLTILALWMSRVPLATGKARALWEAIQPQATEAQVLAMLKRKVEFYRAWIEPYASQYSPAVRAVLDGEP